MSPNGLRQFLEKEQSMKEVNAEFAVGLIRRFDPSPSKEMGRMTLAGIIELFPLEWETTPVSYLTCALKFSRFQLHSFPFLIRTLRFYGANDVSHVRCPGWRSPWWSDPGYDPSSLSLFYGFIPQHVLVFFLFFSVFTKSRIFLDCVKFWLKC